MLMNTLAASQLVGLLHNNVSASDITNWGEREKRAQKPERRWCQQACAASWVLNRGSQSRCPCCGWGCLLGNWSQTQLQGGASSACVVQACALAASAVFFLASLADKRRMRTCRPRGRESEVAEWEEEERSAGREEEYLLHKRACRGGHYYLRGGGGRLDVVSSHPVSVYNSIQGCVCVCVCVCVWHLHYSVLRWLWRHRVIYLKQHPSFFSHAN